MAKVPNGVEKLPKISTVWVRRTSVTDRQTDGRQHNYSEREREFTFATNCDRPSVALSAVCHRSLWSCGNMYDRGMWFQWSNPATGRCFCRDSHCLLGTGCAPLMQCLGRLSLPPSVGWWGFRGRNGAISAFIKWTAWPLALAMASPWWHHHKDWHYRRRRRHFETERLVVFLRQQNIYMIITQLCFTTDVVAKNIHIKHTVSKLN